MRILFSFVLFSVLAISGCKTDSAAKKEINQEDLIGEWEIYYATRNGNVTKSLENGNFVFEGDNSVSSNLFTTSNSVNFTFDKGIINIQNEPNMSTLKINKLQNDTLILSSKMRVFDMEFHLKRK